MSSRLDKFTKTAGVLCLLGLFVSCQDTIPNRSTITDGKSVNTPPTCEADEELVTEGEGEEAVQVCKPKATGRPSNAIMWKSDFCGCKDGKPVTLGNCATFCAGKNTGGAETLFASFTVTEAISLGGLGNVSAWCRTPLPGDTQNPECELQAKDEAGDVTSLAVNVAANSSSLTANIQDGLAYDKTYVLTLVEKVSGAKSNSIQLIKFSPTTNLSLLGPLKNAPISQYTCMVREFSTDEATGDIFYESAYRLHFYFIPRLPPKPIPAGNSQLICHDIFNPLYGLVDQELYPRFEQIPGVFNLWDTMDPRFYDNNGNGAMDVNEVIIQKTKNFGGTIPTGTNFFQPFAWPGAPELESEAGGNNSSGSTTTQPTLPLGYYMAPWIDQTTFRSYCLNSTHYNSSNPLFKAMRDIIGVDTEGIYIGEKTPEAVTTSTGTVTTGFSDYILIRETDLKAVWFYVNAGVPTAPTDANVANNAVFFYYPLNKASPFVKTSTQRIFRVKGANEFNSGNSNQTTGGTGSTPTGGSTSYPPHDRKIGCVPKF
jgi:hypothetical protein